jgi:hypothetical protein
MAAFAQWRFEPVTDEERAGQESGNHPSALSAALTFSKTVAAMVARDREIV